MSARLLIVQLSQVYKSKDDIDEALSIGKPVVIMNKGEFLYQLIDADVLFDSIPKPALKPVDGAAKRPESSDNLLKIPPNVHLFPPKAFTVVSDEKFLSKGIVATNTGQTWFYDKDGRTFEILASGELKFMDPPIGLSDKDLYDPKNFTTLSPILQKYLVMWANGN